MAEADRTKRCSQCKQSKPLDAFAKDRTKVDGLCNICKACKYAYKNAWQKKNRDKANQSKRRHAEKVRPIAIAERAAVRQRKAEAKAQAERELIERRAVERVRRKKLRRIRQNEWRRLYRKPPKPRCEWTAEQVKRERERMRNRYRTNPRYNLSQRLRKALRNTVCDKGGRSAFTLLGYTPEQLVTHLRSTLPIGWTWQDVLDGQLHIDHIVPIAAFNFTSVNDPDFKRCWALSNLQLLPGSENCRKSDSTPLMFQPCLTFVA